MKNGISEIDKHKFYPFYGLYPTHQVYRLNLLRTITVISFSVMPTNNAARSIDLNTFGNPIETELTSKLDVCLHFGTNQLRINKALW